MDRKLLHEISITEINGIKIGHAQDKQGATGCTVIICEKGAATGVDVRGSAPAGRETDAIKPGNICDAAHAVVLSGGSAFGLDAAAGVMEYLEERGIGFDVGMTVVPIVCGASIFDLTVGDSRIRPDRAMGRAACENASGKPVPEGNVGAGTGASIGKFMGTERSMKSGLGTYAVQLGDLQVGAIVTVNALGDVFDLDTGRQIGGLLSPDKKELCNSEELMYQKYTADKNYFAGNTTIGCIVTNAKLDKTQMMKIASMAHDGMARTIRPVHTWADGDSIFAMATGEVAADANAVGTLAARVMGYAVNRGVQKAVGDYGLISASELNF
ncbi:P1 family peptidase [Ruminococcus sp. OA3]|uniref:P1 family peptidase n=1 Tax=Ruminococcus sp. OA3 TaxID=2914164 RepID=UPI001F064689|nr:P1 family peptidase [Ruminococcus sp. OA3]MCH1983167.1 P1 family peptidase [Ruminococcus sp. OA3]